MNTSIRAFATSISINENVQKNLGDSTHIIGRTRFMQMMHTLFSGANELTYANVPTCDGVTVPRWYAYGTSSLDTQTGT